MHEHCLDPLCDLVMVILSQLAFRVSVEVHGPIRIQNDDVTFGLSTTTMVKTFMHPLLLYPLPNASNHLETVFKDSTFHCLGMVWNAIPDPLLGRELLFMVLEYAGAPASL